MRIPELLREALDHASASHGQGEEREPGFHASRSGACYRQVLTEVLNKGFLPTEIDYESQKIFRIGHLLHDFAHEALTRRVWHESGQVMVMQPTRLVAFEDASCGFRVVGTPDEVLYVPAANEIHVVDLKTAHERTFAHKSRLHAMYGSGSSNGHRLQVGTYIAAMKELFPEVSFKGWVAYINKNDMTTVIENVGGNELALEAANYWVHNVKPLWLRALNEAIMPSPTPMEGWQCGYCSLFPQPDAKSTPTKKKRARAECVATTDLMLLGIQDREATSDEANEAEQMDMSALFEAATRRS